MKKPDKVDEIGAVMLARVKLAEERLKALNFACRPAKDNFSRVGQPIEDVGTPLRTQLYRELHDAHRDLFMWGLVLGGETQKRAIEILREQLLPENHAVMQYLDINGKHPSGYYSYVEDELRNDIARRFIKLGQDPIICKVACPTCHAERGMSCRTKDLRKLAPHPKRRALYLVGAVKDDKKES